VCVGVIVAGCVVGCDTDSAGVDACVVRVYVGDGNCVACVGVVEDSVASTVVTGSICVCVWCWLY